MCKQKEKRDKIKWFKSFFILRYPFKFREEFNFLGYIDGKTKSNSANAKHVETDVLLLKSILVNGKNIMIF